MTHGWKVVNLGDVCDLIGGGTPSKKNEAFFQGDIPWATVRDMKKDVIERTEFSVTEDAIRNSSTNIIKANNVVIATRVGLGKVCLIKQDTAINQDLRGVVPKGDKKLDVRFLFWWLKSVAKVIEDEGVGATVKGVKLPFVKSLQIPLPSLEEQKRIVAILDEAFAGIDTAIANTEKNLANARELFESYLNEIFSRSKSGGVEKSLNTICRFSSGGTPSKKNSEYWNGSIPWVSGRDMKSARLTDATLHISQKAVDESSTRMAPEGTLLVLVRGMGLAHGAQIAELMVPCAFNQDIRAIHTNNDIVPRYLLFALRNRIDSSDNVLSNAAHGTLKIDMAELKKVQVPSPPTEQQQRVVSKIDELIEEVQRLENIYQRKLAALKELKQSLLQKAFSGELIADNNKLMDEAVA